MFMRICLLLLFLIGSAQAAQIETEYRVLPVKGSLGRRADVEFQCNLSSNTPSRDYVLTVKREGGGAVLTISFRGEGITVSQPLKKGQKLGNGKLEKIDPLSGDVLAAKEFAFKNGRVSFQNLSPKYIYRLSYTLIANPQNDLRIVSPEVSVLKGDKKDKRQGNAQLLKFTVPVFFSPGSYYLDENARYTLDGVKSLLKVCDVKITGYADNSKIVKSKVPSNKELAKLRALSVKNYLLK